MIFCTFGKEHLVVYSVLATIADVLIQHSHAAVVSIPNLHHALGRVAVDVATASKCNYARNVAHTA